MSITAPNSATGLTNEINVTPMIDVLLVLLIIFMMIVPMARKAIDIQLPDPQPQQTQQQPDTRQIVMEVCTNTFSVNKEVIAKDRLSARLKDIYAPRPDKIIFVKGCNEVKYQEVIWAMDVARGAGVKVIGVPPKDAAK